MKKKSITNNFLFNFTYNMTNVLFPVLIVAYASRILLPDGMGKVTYAQNICTYFTLFAGLGVSRHGVREIAKTNGNVKIREKVFSEIYFIQAISSLIICVLYYYIINTNVIFYTYKLYLNVSGITLITAVFNVEWFYTGMEEFAYIAKRNICVKVISIVILFLIVRDSKDLVQYAFILVIANGGNQIFNIIGLRKYISKIYFPSHILYHLRPAIILLGMNIAVELYTQLDTTMVGILCGDEYVAYYSNANKIMRYLTTMIASVCTVLMPRMSQMIEQKQKKELEYMVNQTISIILTVSIPAMLGVFILSEDIVYVMLGNKYEQSVMTLRILAFLIPILTMGNLLGSQTLVAFGDDKKLLYTVIFGAISNVLLNIFLIPQYYQNGAALASLVAETIVCIAQYFMVKRHISIKIDTKCLLKIIAGSIPMASVFLLSILSINQLQRLILGILIGIVIYTFVQIITKNTTYLWILRKIMNIILRKK